MYQSSMIFGLLASNRYFKFDNHVPPVDQKKRLSAQEIGMTTINNSSQLLFIKHRNILIGLFLIVATLAVYWQVRNFDFVNFDDNEYVYDNRYVQVGLTLESIKWAFTTTHEANWHPLTWLSHMMDYQLYGMNSGGHHLTNLLYHIINSLLLFLVFRKMTDNSWRSGFVAALFALHPLHVESVTWISERKDVLSTFFWMLTMWSYIRYVERPAVKRYLIVIVFLALGLMSKPMVVTLPFVLLLLDFWPLDRLRFQTPGAFEKFQPRSIVYRLIVEKIPFFVLVALSSTVTFYAQKSGMAVVSLEVIPLDVRIANALVAYVKYIGMMVYPSKLAAMYPYPAIIQYWEIIGASLLLVSISFLAISAIKQKPYFAFGWLWYLGTLVPVIGLVQVGSQSMADRYTYIPLIGLFIVIAWGVPEVVARWRYKKMWLATVATVFLSILMTLTWKQAGYWQDSITLYEHTLEVTSNNCQPHYNLAKTLKGEGRIDEAINHYLHALRIKPEYAEVHYDLANALYMQKRVEEAINHYLHALRIKPEYAEAHNNLGLALTHEGRTDEAIDHYLHALRVKPDYGKARYNLDELLEFSKNIDGNIAKIEKGLTYKPNDPFLNYLLGNMYRVKGKPDKAMEYYQKALSLQPDLIEAMYHLAKLFIIKLEYEKALSLYQKMIRFYPNNAGVYYNIACIWARQHRPEKSISWLKKAVEKGFNDWNHIKTDIDLENIRGSSHYKEFIKGH